jgi:hypothetical protein
VTDDRLPIAPRRITMWHPLPFQPRPQEIVMAKGQMRVPKEKKKPKADKDKPKQLSAYKQAQMSGSSTVSGPAGKKG